MTPQPGLQALVERWREQASEWDRGYKDVLIECADELQAALQASAEGGLADPADDPLHLLDRILEVMNLPDNTGKGLALTGKGYVLLHRIRTDLAALVRNAALRGGDGWLPIESAPRDGTCIAQVTRGGKMLFDVYWIAKSGVWSDFYLSDPATHYFAIPPPPHAAPVSKEGETK